MFRSTYLWSLLKGWRFLVCVRGRKDSDDYWNGITRNSSPALFDWIWRIGVDIPLFHCSRRFTGLEGKSGRSCFGYFLMSGISRTDSWKKGFVFTSYVLGILAIRYERLRDYLSPGWTRTNGSWAIVAVSVVIPVLGPWIVRWFDRARGWVRISGAWWFFWRTRLMSWRFEHIEVGSAEKRGTEDAESVRCQNTGKHGSRADLKNVKGLVSYLLIEKYELWNYIYRWYWTKKVIKFSLIARHTSHTFPQVRSLQEIVWRPSLPLLLLLLFLSMLLILRRCIKDVEKSFSSIADFQHWR